jgi:hypothetical protein
VTALVVGMQPLLTACGAGFLLGERVSPRQWLGLVLGFAGVALVVANKLGDLPLAECSLPAIAALLGITLGTLYQKRFCPNFDLRTGSVIQFLPTAICTALLASATESMLIEWTPQFVFALLWLVLVLSVGAISLLNLLIRSGSAVNVATSVLPDAAEHGPHRLAAVRRNPRRPGARGMVLAVAASIWHAPTAMSQGSPASAAHPRRRPGLAHHRLRRHRKTGNRLPISPAAASRPTPAARCRPPGNDPCRTARTGGATSARPGGRRNRLRQCQSAIDPAARAGARGGDHRARRRAGWKSPSTPRCRSSRRWSATATPTRCRCSTWCAACCPCRPTPSPDAADALACAIAHAHGGQGLGN